MMNTHSVSICFSSLSSRLMRRGGLLAALLFALHVAPGWAANGSWNNSAGGSWTNTVNWTGGVIANGTNSSASFIGLTPAPNVTVTLDGPRTIGSLTFSVTAAPVNPWILDSGSGGPLTLAVSSGTPTISVNNLATVNAVLEGVNGLSKTGVGTLTLTGANTYSGGTTLSAGTVILSGSGTLGSAANALTLSGSTLNLGGTSQTVGPVTMTNSTLSNGTLAFSSFNGRSGTISAVLAGSGPLTKSTGGTLTLSGVNTLTGAVLITGGTLQLGGGTAGTLSSASSITVTNNAQLLYTTTASATNNAPLTLSGTGIAGSVFPGQQMGAVMVGGSGASLYLNGAITLAGSARIGGNAGAKPFTNYLNSVIGGIGPLSLFAQSGTGYHVLNTNFNYSGDTTLWGVAGNVVAVLGVDDALPPTTMLTLDAWAAGASTNYTQLILNGHNQTLAGLASTANANNVVTNRITNGQAALSTLTVSNAANTVYNGVLGGVNALEDNLALVKSGAAALTFNRAHTYTGATTLSNGVLYVNLIGNGGAASGIGASDNAASNLVFAGGTLAYYGATASSDRSFTIDPAAVAVVDVGAAATRLTLTGTTPSTAGSLRKTGPGSLALDSGTATNTVKGFSTGGGTNELKSGTLLVAGITTAQAAGQFTNSFVTAGGGTFLLTDGTVRVTPPTFTYIFTAGRQADGAGVFTQNGGTFDCGNNEVLNAFGAAGTATINGGTFSCGLFRVSQHIGVGVLNLNGGTLALNTLSAAVTNALFYWNGGTLKARQNNVEFISDTTGQSPVVFIKSLGAVIDTDTYDVTIPVALQADPVSGGGGLTKLGSGTLTLGGTNTYAGATVVSNGVLRLTHDQALSELSDVSVASGATVALDFTGTQTIRRLYIDGVLKTINKSYGAEQLPLALSGTGALLTTEGAAPIGTLIRLK